MSGDVQPRKRKDKKKKKDDLGIEEPRGTAAALGEGDVYLHSHHDHGTGGNLCAKIIFFSLLGVLVTLIGLIILENRGLTDLEANSVESRYSGVLEGWLEDAADDGHHDEHTLELKHHDDENEDEDHGSFDHDDEPDDDDDDEHDHDDNEDDGDDELDHDEDDENEPEDDENASNEQDENNYVDSQQANYDNDEDEESDEQNLESAEDDEDEVEERSYRKYYENIENQVKADDDGEDDDDLQKVDENYDESAQIDDNDDDEKQNDRAQAESKENDDNDDEDSLEDENDDGDNKSKEYNDINSKEEDDDNNSKEDDDDNEQDNEDEEEDHEDHDAETDFDVEVEHIEKEFADEDGVSAEADDEDKSQEVSKEASPFEVDNDEVEFLEPDELDDLPDVLPIPVPKGKPLAEFEETSTEKPQDTLADEEEYERQQEELRREKEQSSHGMWLKVVVGGALLLATHAVLRRATAPREPDEEHTTREETPLSDRRMTLIPEPAAPPALATPKLPELARPLVQKEISKQAPEIVKQPSPPTQEEDEEIEESEEEEEIIIPKAIKPVQILKDAELYSDDEEVEEEEEEIVESPKPGRIPEKEVPKPTTPIEKKEAPKPIPVKEPTPEPEDDDDDVEIIDDEQLEEELEEEEISDVDDAELLNRLEAKYGRLPEPERPGRKKDGGNRIDDEWPGEPSDAFWRDELDHAERDQRQGQWTAASERASAAQLRSSARARFIVARALDSLAEAKRDNALLTKAIAAYLELLKMNERLSDKKLIEVAERALDRIKFRGNYLGAEPVYRLLIRRFPNDPTHRNNLTVSFLMANRVDLAEQVLKETLQLWPNDRIALAHHGFVLKTNHNRLEEAVEAFTKALEGDAGPANEPRFYYHLGDSLLLLGRFQEAHEIHKRGAALGHFLSPSQRSLYNVERLKSKPWWNVYETPYAKLARALEKSWKEILKEGQAAQMLYEKEKEGLKERGEWSQLDLFVRGREVPNRCSRAPVTCSIVRSEAAAAGCRRGQVKFSSMGAGTHVRPHVGPTNCRLRMHLGLSNTKDTFIRVDQETRQWQTGKVLMFDDSFEHEVWHNGTGTRLVLIVDAWHPDLTPAERKQLPAI